MVTKAIVLLSIAAVAFCNDLHSGFSDSREKVIFEQTYDYKPNIYVRSETVTVNTNGDDVINKIEVTDKRELKDGESTIIAGGVGQKSVSILLKSPAVFRGMTFVVKVWAVGQGNLGNAVDIYNGQRNVGRNVGDYYAGRSENFEIQRNEDLNTGLRTGTAKADGRYDNYETQRNEELNSGLKPGTGLKTDGRYDNYETQRNEELNSGLKPGTGLRTDGTADGVSVSYGLGNGQSRNGQYNYGTKTGSYVYDRQGQELSNSYTKQ